MGISGTNGAGFAAFAARLRKLGSPTARDAVNKAAADAIKPLLRGEFLSGIDPYGTAWRATIAGNYPPLIGKTGAMSGSADATPSSTGVVVYVTDWKAVFHQGGTKRGIPARPMLPTDGRLPPRWREAISHAFLTQVRAQLGA